MVLPHTVALDVYCACYVMYCCTLVSVSHSTKTSYAANRKSQPSSTVCAVVDLFSELNLLGIGSVESYSSGEEAYNLKSLCDMEGVTYGIVDDDDDTQTVEELYIGKAYIDSIIRSLPGTLTANITTVADTEIKAFKKLSTSVYSSRQKPDIAILASNEHVILLFEIESCSSRTSFQNTIRKTILGVIDSIHHFKGLGLHSISEWTGFTFPKFSKLGSVVKVDVKFDLFTFKFLYTLSHISKGKVREEVIDIFKKNLASFKRIRRVKEIESSKDYYIQLSEEELGHFGSKLNEENVCQLKSVQSILLKGHCTMYKFPVLLSDSTTLLMMSLFIKNPAGNVIELNEETVYDCYNYTYIPWQPLSEEETQSCLGDFVSRVSQKIEFLHAQQVAHLDIRINNICFNNDCEPILIDLDRSRKFNQLKAHDIYPDSVMYNPKFDAEQHDWLQLGYLILWVLTSHLRHLSYHKQDLLVDHSIVRNHFFQSLINKGNVYTEVPL